MQKDVLYDSVEFWKSEKLGFSDIEAWENMQNVLLAIGLLPEPLDLEEAFTNQFVNEVLESK